MPEISSRQEQEITRILTGSHVVAVLGAHPDPRRPAHFVPRYLHEQGYDILPVNPVRQDGELWGRTPVATLAELRRPVDVVDVFRRSERLSAHVPDILAMDPLPKVVWFQQGIRNDEVARRLTEAGIDVVQDACMLALHKKLGLNKDGGGENAEEARR